jgi:hypothetical protein
LRLLETAQSRLTVPVPQLFQASPENVIIWLLFWQQNVIPVITFGKVHILTALSGLFDVSADLDDNYGD